jgi:GTP-binding protein
MGVVLEKMALRKGKMVKMINHGSGRVRLDFHVPTRGLIGVRTEIMTDTAAPGDEHPARGLRRVAGEIARRATGCWWRTAQGTPRPTPVHMEDRGELFVGAGTAVYEGMIVGENARPRTWT